MWLPKGKLPASPPLADTTEVSMAELPALYAEAGLWVDALAASAALKQDDRPSEWNALLDAVELSELIAVELLSSPSPMPQATSAAQ